MEIDKVNFPFAFSIVMSVYNVEEFINEAVDSLITQDIGFTENVQIVFVNDGSTDRSGEICEEYQKLYPENIIVIHKANGGLSSARNEGLKYVSYNVIALFALLYFFQGLQVVNKAFDKFQVSIFIRSLLFLFIFLYFTVVASIIVLIGIFSIWFKPKWLEKDSSNTDKKENDNGRNF